MKNIFKIFYRPLSLKRKILDIIDDIEMVIKGISTEKFKIEWYGAYEINPKNLAIWICVEKDSTKSQLMSNQELINDIKEIFVKHNYPKELSPLDIVEFESQETVDRESGGDWHLHFQ